MNNSLAPTPITTTTTTPAPPALRVVGEPPPLNLGPLAEEHAKVLGGNQAVIDAAIAAGATTVAPDGAQEWAEDTDGTRAFVTLTGLDGMPFTISLAATDPMWLGGLLIIPATVQHIDEASPVVIAEGTANALGLAAFAPEGAIVACVPSPWILSDTELDAPGVDELVAGRRVILCPAANPTTDRSAHDRVRKVSALLASVGATSVTFIDVPNGTPLEFLTGHRADPAASLTNLIASAPLISKVHAPAARRRAAAGMATYTDGQASLGDFVSGKLGQIVSIAPEQHDDTGKVSNPAGQSVAGYLDGKPVYAWRTLFEAAVTVQRTIEVLDDLALGSNPVLRHVLDVQIGAGEEATHHSIEVGDSELSDPSRWRTFIGAEGAAIRIGDGGMGATGGQRIAEAIRGTITESTPVDTRLMRTGWLKHGGVAWWLDAKGGHGPEDKTPAIAAMVHNAAALIDIPAASKFTPAEIQASVRDLLGVLERVDHGPWMTGLAATFYALAGQNPEAVLWLVGGEGAGKSFLLGMQASILGPEFGPKRGMFKPEATVAAMRASLHECHNVPMWIDDVRARASARNQVAQDDAMELAIRTGYEGGSAIPAKTEQEASGKWVSAPIRSSHPFVCVGGEALPPEQSTSSIERLLVVHVHKGTSMRPGAKKHLEDLLARRAFAPAAAAFLRDRARTITENHEADLHAARDALSAHTDAMAERWLDGATLAGVTPRVREVARTFLAGAAIFLEFAAECGAISIQDSEREYRRWAKVILTAATDHYAANLESAGIGDQILEGVKNGISAGRLCIGKPTDREIPVGGIVVVDGQEHVALIPTEVQKVAKELGFGGSGVAQKMAPVLLVGLTRPARRARVNGGESIWAYVVLPEKMDPAFHQTTTTEGSYGKMQTRRTVVPETDTEPEPELDVDTDTELDTDFDTATEPELDSADLRQHRATIERVG